jgi:hypothetical protein
LTIGWVSAVADEIHIKIFRRNFKKKIPLNSELHCIFYRYSKEVDKVVPVSKQDVMMA